MIEKTITKKYKCLFCGYEFEQKVSKSLGEFDNKNKVYGKKGTLIYEDLRCPFLDRKTRLCKIYENRPKVCIDYGNIEKLQCPYFKRSGNVRSEGSRKQIEKDLDRKINLLNKKIL